MKAVLQRVERASVTVDGVLAGAIERGYVVLLGIGQNDLQQTADRMIDKIKKLRLFPDENGKTNLNINEIQGELLVISQFTLYADCRKGNRPGFAGAGSPEKAEALYDYFVSACKPHFHKTACGSFGAHMKVALVNDGPFTVVLDME